MYIINTSDIKNAVKSAFETICVKINDDALSAMENIKPSSEIENFALSVMVDNAKIACKTNSPVCQDTGLAVIFAEIGQDVVLQGDYFENAINQGVKNAYKSFRKSSLTPLSRINTLDNTPAIIHTKIVKGHNVKLSCMAKGFGSENMSKLYMLTPADGVNGVIQKVVDTVKQAGSCPCPPVIVGVGIGGDFEKCAIMSKHALLRQIGSKNPNENLNDLEKILCGKINNLKIGAQGFGGNTTALAVFIETAPTHIAGLPLAINIQCHCSRHTEIILEGKCIK